MFILQRRPGESIIIVDSTGTKTTVNTVRGKGDRIRYEINAPKEVKIIRGEVQDARQTA